MKVETDFDVWFAAQGYIEDDGCLQEKYLAARDAWDAQRSHIEEVIDRLERLPTCSQGTLDIEYTLTVEDFRERVVGLWEELL